jgi:hypothetical protein
VRNIGGCEIGQHLDWVVVNCRLSFFVSGLDTDTTASLRPLNVFDAVANCSMASTFAGERAIVLDAGTQHRCTSAE